MVLASSDLPGRQLLLTSRLRQRRNQLGLTQKQVVARLGRQGVRTSNRTLSTLEHGAGIDVSRLPELARALECTVTFLLGLTDDPHRWTPDLPDGPRPAPGSDPAALAPRRSAPHRSAPAEVQGLAAPSCWILGPDIPERPSPPLGPESDRAPAGPAAAAHPGIRDARPEDPTST